MAQLSKYQSVDFEEGTAFLLGAHGLCYLRPTVSSWAVRLGNADYEQLATIPGEEAFEKAETSGCPLVKPQ